MDLKKIIVTALASTIVSAGAAVCEAAETVLLNDALADTSKIVLNSEAAQMEEVDGGITFTDAVDAVASFGQISGSIESDMSFELEGEEWVGFQLMSETEDQRCWMTNCYVIVVKAGNVEIQVFNAQKGSGYLANYNYQLPINEKINVKTGVIPMQEGNYIFIKLGDTVFGAIDENNIMQEEGYFAVEGALDGLTLYETESVEEDIPCAQITYDPKENKLSAQINSDSGAVYNWYLSTDEFIYDPIVKTTDPQYFELVDGVDSSDLILQDNEIGKYAFSVAKVNELNVYSNVCRADPVEYIFNNGFIGCIGYTNGFAEGKGFIYDSSDSAIYPDFLTENAYIPLRGIMDGYGCPVEWNEADRTVSITTPQGTGNSTLVKFSVDKQGFIDSKGLMGSAMTDVPKLINSRTFLDVYSTAAILDYDNVFIDEGSGLIVMMKPDIELSGDEIRTLCDRIELGE